MSFLKGGIDFNDLVTTVSERYAKEILTLEYGCAFEGIMNARRAVLWGIINGIDVDEWNPERDSYLPLPCSMRDLDGKRESKRSLLERYQLPASEADLQRPVIGLISRLVYQKGVDLLGEALAGLGATFVVLGNGEPKYEEMWRAASTRHPHTFGVRIGYDEALAHLIEAGADMFSMPSRYEPCGLNQMYSMRYGTAPIVRATGSLDDVVAHYDPRIGCGSGFKFEECSSTALLEAVRTALHVFADREWWHQIQLEGMRRDFSWDIPARAYVREYVKLVRAKRG